MTSSYIGNGYQLSHRQADRPFSQKPSPVDDNSHAHGKAPFGSYGRATPRFQEDMLNDDRLHGRSARSKQTSFWPVL